ncbi:MAG TPA: vitamin K epoxide reductase family protein [Candidatus Saccharimonadales bacterium]|nr:vitamin K epoxide reductase family protein [Candidatus Saccharimonadales bacterium]
MPKSKKTKSSSNRWVFGTMLVFGIIGLLASFVLAIEEFHLLKNPDAVLSCSFNIVLNCSTVMKTWQASVFGFPNMFIGLMGYSVVITVAVVGLSGTNLKRWFMVTANICYGLGALFAYWLFFNSVYVIEVLCPWCLVVTLATTLLLATITHYNLRENNFGFRTDIQNIIEIWQRHDVLKFITAGWIVIMIALVFIKFGESLFA